MSKKKLLLASAVFAAGMFAASCGGGGDGGTTPEAGGGEGGGEGGGTGGAPATVVKKVLAVAQAASAGVAGAQYKYYVFSLKDDGTLDKTLVSNDSSFDTPMYGIHEFANGNKLLQDAAGNFYLYDQANNKLVNLNYSSGSYGINAFASLTPTYVRDNNWNFIFSNGTKVSFDNTNLPQFTGNYVVGIESGSNDLIVVNLTDGSKTVIKAGVNPANVTSLASLGPVVVVQDSNDYAYVVMDNGSYAELPSDTSFNVRDASWNNMQAVKSGSDYYLAIGDTISGNLYYMKVSGTTVSYDTPISYLAAANVPANGEAVIQGEDRLDASGNLFTVLGIDTDSLAGADAYKPRVYSNPASLVSYEPTSSYTSLSLSDLNGVSTGTPSMVGDGVAVYYDSSNYIFVNTSATPQTPGVPTGFIDILNCMAINSNIRMQSGNTFLCISADNANDDPTYYAEISPTGVQTFTKGKISNGTNKLDNTNRVARLGSTTYYEEKDSANNPNGNIYACTLSPTPCSKLSNVKKSDLVPASPKVETQANQIVSVHIASKSLYVTHDGTSCTAAGDPLPVTGATIVDIENDSKQSVPVNLTVSCVSGSEDDTARLKVALPIDLSGAVAYGTNPVLNPKCAAAGGFDILNLRLEDGTTISYNLADEGLCLVNPMGFVK